MVCGYCKGKNLDNSDIPEKHIKKIMRIYLKTIDKVIKTNYNISCNCWGQHYNFYLEGKLFK